MLVKNISILFMAQSMDVFDGCKIHWIMIKLLIKLVINSANFIEYRFEWKFYTKFLFDFPLCLLID